MKTAKATSPALERRARRMAFKHGYIIRKLRGHIHPLENLGEFQVYDSGTGLPAAGFKFDMSAADVIEWLHSDRGPDEWSSYEVYRETERYCDPHSPEYDPYSAIAYAAVAINNKEAFGEVDWKTVHKGLQRKLKKMWDQLNEIPRPLKAVK
jgi:hypothetical protein